MSLYEVKFKGEQKGPWIPFRGEATEVIESGFRVLNKPVLLYEHAYVGEKINPNDKTFPDEFIVQLFYNYDQQSFIRNKNLLRMLEKMSQNLSAEGFFSMASIPFAYRFYPSPRSFNKQTNTSYALMRSPPVWKHILDTSTSRFHWFMFNALSALFYLHKLGIVHRAISPETVYFSKDNNDYSPSIFIHDFSSACWLEDQTDLTQIVRCRESPPMYDYTDPVLLPKSRQLLQQQRDKNKSKISSEEEKKIRDAMDGLKKKMAELNKEINDAKGNDRTRLEGQRKELGKKLGELGGKLHGRPGEGERMSQAVYAPYTDKSDVFSMGMLFYQIATQGIGYTNEALDPWDPTRENTISMPPDQIEVFNARKQRLTRTNLSPLLRDIILGMIQPEHKDRLDAGMALKKLISAHNPEMKIPDLPPFTSGAPQKEILQYLGSREYPELQGANINTLAKMMMLKWADVDAKIDDQDPASEFYGSFRESRLNPSPPPAESWAYCVGKGLCYTAAVGIPLVVGGLNPVAAGVGLATAGLGAAGVHNRLLRKISERWRR